MKVNLQSILSIIALIAFTSVDCAKMLKSKTNSRQLPYCVHNTWADQKFPCDESQNIAGGRCLYQFNCNTGRSCNFQTQRCFDNPIPVFVKPACSSNTKENNIRDCDESINRQGRNKCEKSIHCSGNRGCNFYWNCVAPK